MKGGQHEIERCLQAESVREKIVKPWAVQIVVIVLKPLKR